jgi:putative membrane protein
MKRPTAIPIEPASATSPKARIPRAFALTEAAPATEFVESHSDQPLGDDAPVPLPRMGWLPRLLWASAGLFASLAIGLGLNALVASLFAANPWVGWAGLALVAIFLLALLALLARELRALSRLRTLDHLRTRAIAAIAADRMKDARPIVAELGSIYAPRPDLARALEALTRAEPQIFDGAELLKYTERTLMAPLDQRARALTAASARRVALVTAISPRALVDIAYVVWESIRLGGAIARLYGARPGLWGTWRLIGAILSHLAVTGGLVLTDGVVEQLVGQGLAARLSQRLGEGVVNGLMTVRVGIAAIRVVRPLPFTTEPSPMVRDYLPELLKIVKGKDAP